MKLVARGDVWLADLGKPTGHEQAEKRPVVIIQSDRFQHLGTTIVVPLTTAIPKDSNAVTHVAIPGGEGGLTESGYALCHHLRVLDRRKLLKKYGELPPYRLGEIEAAVAFILEL